MPRILKRRFDVSGVRGSACGSSDPKRAVRLAALLCCLAITSCTTAAFKGYEGAVRPDSDTALIRVQKISNDRTAARIRIRSFDTARGDVVPVRVDRLRVLPRRTCVEAAATSSTLDRYAAELCFEPTEGRNYEIRALTRGSPQPPQLVSTGYDIPIQVNAESGPFNVTTLFIVDMTTHDVVAYAER